MDFLQAAALAGAIITSQGAVWRPVTVQTMFDQEPAFYRSSPGAVTNEYKKPVVKNTGCVPLENNDLQLYSLSCSSAKAAGL